MTLIFSHFMRSGGGAAEGAGAEQGRAAGGAEEGAGADEHNRPASGGMSMTSKGESFIYYVCVYIQCYYYCSRKGHSRFIDISMA